MTTDYENIFAELRKGTSMVAYHADGEVRRDICYINLTAWTQRRKSPLLVLAVANRLRSEPTANTLEWLRFMVDPELSPWHDILGHLENTDPEFINENGFIFKPPVPDIHKGLLFSFLIAARTCCERRRHLHWMRFVEWGAPPRVAAALSEAYSAIPGRTVSPQAHSNHSWLDLTPERLWRLARAQPILTPATNNRHGNRTIWGEDEWTYEFDEAIPFDQLLKKCEDLLAERDSQC